MDSIAKNVGAKRRRIGERFVEAGYITQQQLEVALSEQKKIKEPLGQILVNLGFIEEENLSRVIAEDLGVPFVRLKDFDLDVNLINEIDESFAREHLFVPIKREEDGRITVAMADPSNIFTIDAIQNFYGRNIHIMSATLQDILNTIASTFNTDDGDGDFQMESGDLELISYSVIEKVDDIIEKALTRRATDIHIEPEEKLLRVRYRMDGILQQGDILPKELTSSILTRFKILSWMDITERRKPQDGRFTRKKGSMGVDFRVSTMPTAYGENIVIRLLDRSSVNLNLKSLGIDEDTFEMLTRVSNMSHGMFLASGPTGSGKTTTLYAMILLIDAMARKVVTIEDPIEYKLPLIRQSQVDHEIGYDFADGLRTILRQDPDVILVGEIRDPETADIAVKSSMTGHMVFSSIHTNNAMAAVQRLLDLGIERHLISSTLTAVLGQRLVRRICPKCRENYEASEAELKWLGRSEAVLSRGTGCAACHSTGYSGRTVIFELFLMDEEFADLVSRRRGQYEFIKLAREKNVRFMVDEGRKKVMNGITTAAEVMRVCNEIERL